MAFLIKIPFVVATHVKKFTSTSQFKDKSKAAAIGSIGGRLFFNVGGGVVLPVSGTSAPVVVSAATLTLSPLTHAGLTVVITSLTGCAVTLPAATGTGNVYRIVRGVAPTSGSDVFAVASGTDFMRGQLADATDDADNVGVTFPTSNTGTLATESDTITWNRTTTGVGAIGDFVEFRDIVAATFLVQGQMSTTGAEATPFSAVV